LKIILDEVTVFQIYFQQLEEIGKPIMFALQNLRMKAV
jgi:hypothetical protein